MSIQICDNRKTTGLIQRCVVAGLIVSVLHAGVAQGQEKYIIPIAGAAGCYGSGYFPMENAFDDQPVWSEEIGAPVNDEYAGADAPYYADRWGYIDFGEEFDQVTIVEGWTRYRTWSVGIGCGYQEAFWTDIFPGAWPGVLANRPEDAITESVINFNNNTVPSQESILWMRSFTFEEGFTPPRRYLAMHFATEWGEGYTNNRASEYAFVGERLVHDPATLITIH